MAKYLITKNSAVSSNPRMGLAGLKVFVVYFCCLFSLAAVAEQKVEKRSQEQAVWVDVRSWGEYQIDHIEGDPRIHYSEIVDGISASYPDKATPILLYCAKGGRAQKALKSLQSAGYTNIRNMGGIDQVRKMRGQ